MWKTSLIKTCKNHCLEYALLLVITFTGLYIIGIELNCSGGVLLLHILMTGFFGVMAIVYPVVTILKEYFDLCVTNPDCDKTKNDIDS